MFRISTPGNSRSGYFFNKKLSLIVGVCEDLEGESDAHSFGKASDEAPNVEDQVQEKEHWDEVRLCTYRMVPKYQCRW